MRRDYISPEYFKKKTYGTYNMLEESNFFAAKMLDIEDSIVIDNLDIIWYQKLNNEQLDITIESTLDSYVYSPSNDKLNNHTLEIDKNQPRYQLDKDTRWLMIINLESILSNYLFATLKKNRTFEGVRNEFTRESDVDIAIRKYIDFNIKNRYKFSKIELFIRYRDLRNQNLLRYNNNWNTSISIDNRIRKIQTETASDQSNIKVLFNQEKPSNQFAFDYFFNLTFEKI